MMEKEKVVIVGSEIFTWRDGRAWIAAWRRRDLIAQGPDEKTAVERLIQTIAFTWLIKERDGGELPPPPPEESLRRWTAKHEAEHRPFMGYTCRHCGGKHLGIECCDRYS